MPGRPLGQLKGRASQWGADPPPARRRRRRAVNLEQDQVAVKQRAAPPEPFELCGARR